MIAPPSMSAPISLDTRGTAARVAVIAATTATPVAELIRALPQRSGLAVVVVCDAEAAGVLRPVSALPVAEARGRVQLEPDHVFVIPPGWEGMFQRAELVTMQADVPQAPIDKLLRSLADAHGRQGIAVIVEGRGNDGVLGIKRLKEAGSLTIAQAPNGDNTAAPRSLIATGMIDIVVPLSQIAERLAALGPLPEDHSPLDETSKVDDAGPRPEGGADALHDILVLMRLRSGHDFGSYKRATLYRRMSRRMQVCQCTTIANYHQYLREHPGELSHLLRDFLVSVTNFFRDHEAFDVLAGVVIPRLFSGKGSGDQVRVWSAGCATGEEAYSLAILLHEFAQKLSEPPNLQIFATDIDENALAEARAGRYPSTISADVSSERLQRFFTPDGDHYSVSKELRETMLFSPHNVLRDPPFSRLDLVACRNLLIYLNRDAQNRVLSGFHFGLRPEGFLFLGSSESAENTTMFAGFDIKHRVFTPRPSTSRLASNSPMTSNRWDRPIIALPYSAAADRNSLLIEGRAWFSRAPLVNAMWPSATTRCSSGGATAMCRRVTGAPCSAHSSGSWEDRLRMLTRYGGCVDDEDRSFEVRRELLDDPWECLDAARRAADHDDVAGV